MSVRRGAWLQTHAKCTSQLCISVQGLDILCMRMHGLMLAAAQAQGISHQALLPSNMTEGGGDLRVPCVWQHRPAQVAWQSTLQHAQPLQRCSRRQAAAWHGWPEGLCKPWEGCPEETILHGRLD